ncbi:hypothetical protein [Tenacibaculum maritimum]|uniref:hypothetical protein n=1 Tax=Tenacibaculum maritimum TaxID=107401 RepID=UPI001E55F611|nr:hypothetical protein [Tenacibaculum maritimum]MCD9584767.1 hypothetical protein [Tenacibaculum maritimum]MCD9621619.1 hypothetical protein [Tenacibaculum maritimum]MCD9626814.1 hypothetical protein [Tenacibaculum maritimum]MCD9630488.1 hypothetical protein [Tenacibaculum maritimum]MCD9633756.1 hypothetical protein [Tenacibaculum maritimum]
MKKISLILICLFVAFSCSKNDEITNAPLSIENTTWYKLFNKQQLESAAADVIDTSDMSSVTLTFKIISSTDFELNSKVVTSNSEVNQTHKGTYNYNSSNGEITFNYKDISFFNYPNINFFGRNSDKGIINENKMLLEKAFTFEKQ